MTHNSYQLVPLTSEVADALRSSDGIAYRADSKPGYPCRQCLRDAEVGEELLLVSYDPFTTDSPYRSASPIFIHSTPCEPPEFTGLPDQLTIRLLSVRAFDSNEVMATAEAVDGSELETTLLRMFADETVDRVHVHNAVRGCWAVSVERRRLFE